MNLLYLISQILKRKTFKAEQKETDFIIISPIDQILNRLKSISKSKNIKDYERIISEMMSNLKYDDIELLIHKSFDLKNRDVFLAALEKKKYNWRAEIENDFLKNNEDAKLSLCTSDYLAYIIGRKYDLHILSHSTNFWKEYYKAFENDLNLLLIQNKLLASLEADNKVHVPINYALSMFFIYDKNIALPKFKRILNNDRMHRLEPLHQAEYFITVGKFFDRIKLNFIPKIDSLKQLNPINFENKDNQYITRDEIKIIIDKEDYFNKRNFVIDKKYLLQSVNICDEKKLKELYFTFFNFFDNEISKNQIDVLYSCFTEINPKYDEFQIKFIRVKLIKLINEKEIAKDLIYFSYYLVTNFLDSSYEKIKFLTSTFFNTKGLSSSTISNVFSDRFGKDKSYSTELPRSLVDKINMI